MQHQMQEKIPRWPGLSSLSETCFWGSAQPQGMVNITATHTSPAPWTLRTFAGCSTTAVTLSRECTSNSTNSCEAALAGRGEGARLLAPSLCPPGLPWPSCQVEHLLQHCHPQAVVKSRQFPVSSSCHLSCSVFAPVWPPSLWLPLFPSGLVCSFPLHWAQPSPASPLVPICVTADTTVTQWGAAVKSLWARAPLIHPLSALLIQQELDKWGSNGPFFQMIKHDLLEAGERYSQVDKWPPFRSWVGPRARPDLKSQSGGKSSFQSSLSHCRPQALHWTYLEPFTFRQKTYHMHRCPVSKWFSRLWLCLDKSLLPYLVVVVVVVVLWLVYSNCTDHQM